jgi:hypothetical protein
MTRPSRNQKQLHTEASPESFRGWNLSSVGEKIWRAGLIRFHPLCAFGLNVVHQFDADQPANRSDFPVFLPLKRGKYLSAR